MHFVTKIAKIYKLLSRQNWFLSLQVWKSGLYGHSHLPPKNVSAAPPPLRGHVVLVTLVLPIQMLMIIIHVYANFL